MANLTFEVNTKHNGNLISTTSHIRKKQVLEWGRSWDTLSCYVLYLWLALLEMVPHWYSLQKTKLLILIEMDWHLKQKFAIAWCSGKTISSCILMPNSEVGLHHKSQNKMIYHNIPIMSVLLMLMDLLPYQTQTLPFITISTPIASISANMCIKSFKPILLSVLQGASFPASLISTGLML